jgi:hypothetical protein
MVRVTATLWTDRWRPLTPSPRSEERALIWRRARAGRLGPPPPSQLRALVPSRPRPLAARATPPRVQMAHGRGHCRPAAHMRARKRLARARPAAGVVNGVVRDAADSAVGDGGAGAGTLVGRRPRAWTATRRTRVREHVAVNCSIRFSFCLVRVTRSRGRRLLTVCVWQLHVDRIV